MTDWMGALRGAPRAALCVALVGCGGPPSLELSGRCAGEDPCLVGLEGSEQIALAPRGGAADAVEALSADASVIRAYNVKSDSVHLRAEGVGHATVEVSAGQGGDVARAVLRFEVAEIASLGLEMPTGPLIANESYGCAARPVDGAGRALGFTTLQRQQMSCVGARCRVSLPEGEHALWNGSAAAPLPVRAVEAERIHWSLDGDTLTYGLAAGEERLQVPDHPSLDVRGESGRCQVEASKRVGASWVAAVEVRRGAGGCALTIEPTVEGRYPGVQEVTIQVGG